MVKREKYIPLMLMLPSIIFLVVLAVYPTIYSLVLSFHSWNLTRPGRGFNFVGLENFINIFTSYRFWYAFQVTAIYVVGALVLQFLLGLGIALLLNREVRGRGVFRALFILPMVMSPIGTGILFRIMYHPTFGIINYFVSLAGISPKTWLASGETALLAVIIADVWQWTPLVALVLLAGLGGLPKEPFEAARIDGASEWQIFRWITLPQLSTLISIILLLRGLDLLRMIDVILVMTKGGPGISTEVFGMRVYKEGFMFFEMGRAAAFAWIILVIVIVVATYFLKVMKRRELR